jgi:hypothetical protein
MDHAVRVVAQPHHGEQDQLLESAEILHVVRL